MPHSEPNYTKQNSVADSGGGDLGLGIIGR